MKYIPGFTFTPKPLQMKGGSVLGQAQRNKKLLNDKTFKAGVSYTIYNIIPEQNNVKYIFNVGGKLEEVNFSSVKQAEKKISQFVGDE